MQYLLVFLVLLCVFGGGAYLVLCNIESALFVSVVVMPFSHNIVALHVVVMLTSSSLKSQF